MLRHFTQNYRCWTWRWCYRKSQEIIFKYDLLVHQRVGMFQSEPKWWTNTSFNALRYIIICLGSKSRNFSSFHWIKKKKITWKPALDNQLWYLKQNESDGNWGITSLKPVERQWQSRAVVSVWWMECYCGRSLLGSDLQVVKTDRAVTCRPPSCANTPTLCKNKSSNSGANTEGFSVQLSGLQPPACFTSSTSFTDAWNEEPDFHFVLLHASFLLHLVLLLHCFCLSYI